MILLTSISDLIQVVTGSNINLDAHASYVDLSGSTVTPGRLNTLIATAATTTVVDHPASSTQRNVKTLSLRNRDASASNLVTVQHTDGSSAPQLVKITLLAGETLIYNEGDGWNVINSTGQIKTIVQTSGQYVGSSFLTSASANFTTGATTNKIKIRGVGGGAGGAGCTSVSSAASGGGGGGAGGYAEKTFAVSPGTAYAYTCGALGSGASGALGGNGTDSTFIVGATTVTAKGGTGAPVATALTTLSAYVGGAGGIVGTNGDINSPGQPGNPGFVLIVATPIGIGGHGGDGPFGAGGLEIAAVGNGSAATGNGAGGGGALTGATTVRTGGNGSAGCWVVDEYT